MTKKDSPDFRGESEITKDMKSDEKQPERSQEFTKKINWSKPCKSGSFVRNWGSWSIRDE